MDYFFYLCISDKYLQFRKKSMLIWAINYIIKSITKGIEILAKRLFSFSIIVFSIKLQVILFIRKEMHLLGNIFGSPHTSNRIHSLRNCFSNYVYLKDMYITLKGIGKILFVSVLGILLICKFLIHGTHITIQSYIQTNSKNSDHEIFLIYKTSHIHMSCSRARTDSYWNTCPKF